MIVAAKGKGVTAVVPAAESDPGLAKKSAGAKGAGHDAEIGAPVRVAVDSAHPGGVDGRMGERDGHRAGEAKAVPLDEVKADMADGGRLTPRERLEQARRIHEAAGGQP